MLVVGGGPAGLAAALAAGRSGARVILCDEQQEFGGALLSGNDEIDGKPAAEWVADATAELADMPEVRVLPRTTAFGYYDHNSVWLVERTGDHLPPGSATYRQRLWKVRAKQVVLATGAIERPLVFADNDRPGIMLAGAARTYANRYGALPGRRVVVMTNNDSAYQAALDLAQAGVTVAAIVDLRGNADSAAVAAARGRKHRGIGRPCHHRHQGPQARQRGLRRADERGRRQRQRRGAGDRVRPRPAFRRLEPDGASVLAIRRQAALRRGHRRLRAGPVSARRNARPALPRAASPSPIASPRASRPALDAARDAGFSGNSGNAPRAEAAAAEAQLRPIWVVPSVNPVGHGAKHFVDHQNDVTAADVLLAEREGYRSVEHLKRYTTMGMGTDQGKTSNVNALAIMAQKLGRDIPQVGTTTFRPPTRRSPSASSAAMSTAI